MLRTVQRVIVILAAGLSVVQSVNLASEKKAKLSIGVEMDSSLSEKESGVWLGYLIARANYVAEHEADYRNQPGAVIPRFLEEVEARGTAATIYSELKEKDAELNLSYFNDLVLVQKAGFMREYVWSFLKQDAWVQPSDLKTEAFLKWRDSNLSTHKVETHGRITLGGDE